MKTSPTNDSVLAHQANQEEPWVAFLESASSYIISQQEPEHMTKVNATPKSASPKLTDATKAQEPVTSKLASIGKEPRQKNVSHDPLSTPIILTNATQITARPNSVLAQASRVQELEKALQTLEPGGWLNDEAINTIISTFPTKESFTILHPLTINEEVENIQHKEIPHDVTSTIIVPIHEPGHWTLAVYHIGKRQIQHFNSRGQECAQQTRKRLKTFAVRRLSSEQDAGWVDPIVSMASTHVHYLVLLSGD